MESGNVSQDDEWADFTTAGAVSSDTHVTSSKISSKSGHVEKKDPTSESWMDSFGTPQVDPTQQIMNQGVGMFPHFTSGNENFGQVQQGSNNMFQPNNAFFSPSTIPTGKSQISQSVISNTSNINDQKESTDKDPFADLLTMSNVDNESKDTSSSKTRNDSSSDHSFLNSSFSQGVSSDGMLGFPQVGQNMSQMGQNMQQVGQNMSQGGQDMSQMNPQQAAAMMQMQQQWAQMQAQMYQQMYYSQQFLHQQPNQQKNVQPPQKNAQFLPK